MKMQKRTFRIGELAKSLAVERFVVRFWEKEFKVKTNRSHGGQRFYTQDDLDTFKLIKELLYERGFTIAGAKQEIKLVKGVKPAPVPSAPIVGSHKTTFHDQEIEELKKEKEALEKRVLILQQQLLKLRELL